MGLLLMNKSLGYLARFCSLKRYKCGEELDIHDKTTAYSIQSFQEESHRRWQRSL